MWLFEDKEFTEEHVGTYAGFVYLITNLQSGRKYIGKKVFKNKVVRKPLKGKTRRRHSTKPSDWAEYYGSNDQLKLDVEELGPENFKREILRLCKSKSECSYYEAKYQFENDVLFSDQWYNSWITCKVTSSHFRGMQKDAKAR